MSEEITTLPAAPAEAPVETANPPVEAAVEAPADPIEPVETAEEVEKKRTSGFEKRVSKLNAKIEQQKQEAEYWRNEALKSRQTPVAPEAPVMSDKPTLSQFASVEEYTEALTEYKLAQRDQAEAARKAQAQQSAILDTYNKRATEFMKSTPDFAEVLEDSSHIPCAAEIHQACLDSDIGPQMAYHLAKNPEEIERISALPPHRRLIEMGKLEDKLASAKPAPKAKPVAPAPVTPVQGTTSAGAASLAEKSIYEMTPQELIKYRNKTKGIRR